MTSPCLVNRPPCPSAPPPPVPRSPVSRARRRRRRRRRSVDRVNRVKSARHASRSNRLAEETPNALIYGPHGLKGAQGGEEGGVGGGGGWATGAVSEILPGSTPECASMVLPPFSLPARRRRRRQRHFRLGRQFCFLSVTKIKSPWGGCFPSVADKQASLGKSVCSSAPMEIFTGPQRGGRRREDFLSAQNLQVASK